MGSSRWLDGMNRFRSWYYWRPYMYLLDKMWSSCDYYLMICDHTFHQNVLMNCYLYRLSTYIRFFLSTNYNNCPILCKYEPWVLLYANIIFKIFFTGTDTYGVYIYWIGIIFTCNNSISAELFKYDDQWKSTHTFKTTWFIGALFLVYHSGRFYGRFTTINRWGCKTNISVSMSARVMIIHCISRCFISF
jgi:hypothetical protein